MTDRRLIEAGFPCHQVGAETPRERDAVSVMPPNYFLHVWWARRPLVASRAAVAASLDTQDTRLVDFLQQLGIEKKVIDFNGNQWVLIGKIEEKIIETEGIEKLPVDKKVIDFFEKEQKRRLENQVLISNIKTSAPELAQNEVIKRWAAESLPLPQIHIGETLYVQRVAGDPAHVNERIEFSAHPDVKAAIGKPLKWSPEDLYGYERAYKTHHQVKPTGLTVLDPTSGGGSIPFEAMRLGHNVIANELNPVASIILFATLDYPARFGSELCEDIDKWGTLFVEKVEESMAPFTPFSHIPAQEVT